MTMLVSDEIEARGHYKEAVAEAEERIQDLIQDPPQPRTGQPTRAMPESFRDVEPDHETKATLWGLRGTEVSRARQKIEFLLNVESVRSGLETPGIYGSEIVHVAEQAKACLEAAKPTRTNRDRIPAVITELAEIIELLQQAEREVSQARARDKKSKAERWPSNLQRSKDTDQWGDVLGWGLDLLDNFGQSTPDWKTVTPSVLASALADLADAQPQLQLREQVVTPLDNGDLMNAWLGLYKLIQRFEEGELTL